jgi:hypothetical protein
MTAHALDGEVRLAGIGRTEDSGNGGTGELGHDACYVGQDRAGSKGFRGSIRNRRSRPAIGTVRRTVVRHANVFI